MNYKDDFKKRFAINVSTARYQLMKKLLFELLIETNKDSCFRCKEKLTLDTISIEHKQPWAWESNAYDLFMDIGNVAFSHGTCNSGAIRITDRSRAAYARRSKVKNNGIECSKCKHTKPFNSFHKNKTNKSGHESLCKSCRKQTRKV